MVPSLSTLPPEILFRTIQNIPESSHLFHLALCCHALYKIILPGLYTRISLKLNEPYTDPNAPKLRLLISRLFVDKAEGEADEKNDGTEAPDPISAAAGSLANKPAVATNDEPIGNTAAERAVTDYIDHEDVSIYDREELIKEAKNNNDDALIAVLFQSVRNLETMNIMVPLIGADIFSILFAWVAAAVRKNLQTWPPIQIFIRLRGVMNSSDDDKYGMSTVHLYHYTRLPAMREIYMHEVGSSGSSEDRDCPLGMLTHGSCPTVERLELRDSKLNAKDLKGMFAACSSLRTFVYDLGWGHMSYCDYSLSELDESLAANMGTLENL
ncbi:MAG: hypothetical protein Q9209_003620 [Squamulea sp. 1 TL-2023]